ncbi:MAG: glycosyltransferase family 2 protein [Acidimicrobiia bacterium]|nr:glycosyltransferase family 2 protein [Acidimicrobiia bacterium]
MSANRGEPGRPRVTVLIPTYNRARFLEQSIASVLDQSFEHLVLHVSDDASTDDTPDVVASFADPRLSYTRQAENIGMLGNFNAGIEVVDTEYVAILNDDDLLLPGGLAAAVNALDEHVSAGFVHSAFSVIGPEGQTYRANEDWTRGLTADTLETGEEFIRESMLGSCRVCFPTVVMRTQVLPAVPFEAADLPAIDLGLWLRIALDWDVLYLSSPRVAFRSHQGSDSSRWGDTRPDCGCVQGNEIIMRVRELKLHFLDRFADRLADVSGLRRRAEHAARIDLINGVRGRTVPEREFVATVQGLARAARLDNRLVGEPEAWRLLAASMLGTQLVDRITERRDAERATAV